MNNTPGHHNGTTGFVKTWLSIQTQNESGSLGPTYIQLSTEHSENNVQLIACR